MSLVFLGNFPYRFLPEMSAEERQNRRSRGTKRLKLRKTLHLADTIGGGKRIQENPPPGAIDSKEVIFIPWKRRNAPLLNEGA